MKPIFSNRLFLNVVSFILLVGVMIACKKEQPEINDAKDPCACASEVSANFTIEERGWGSVNHRFTETDTIYHPKNVRFTALEEDASYTWYLGAEVIHEKSFMRLFDETTVGFDIEVTLVVKKEPNLTCFPDDDGYDSIVKYMYVSQYPILDWNNDTIIRGGITGTYRVKGPHLSDSFEVKVWTAFGVDPLETKVNITNFDGLGTNCAERHADLRDANYRQIWINPVGTCHGLRGYIHNRMDGITEMNFSYSIQPFDGYNIINRIYYGRKIN